MSKDLHMEMSEEELSKQETGLSFEANLLYSNKALIHDKAKRVVDLVADGTLDAHRAYIEVRKGQEYLDQIEKNVKPYIAGKQIQKGGIVQYDSTITEKKDPDKYDFTVCDDPEWNELKIKEADIKAKLKEREEFLKKLKTPMANLDGEIIHPPSITFGKQNIAFSLK